MTRPMGATSRRQSARASARPRQYSPLLLRHPLQSTQRPRQYRPLLLRHPLQSTQGAAARTSPLSSIDEKRSRFGFFYLVET